MKIKKLKTILIGDVVWKIKWDKTHNGGSFDYIKGEIIFGTQCNDLRILTIIIHEIKEIIHTKQATRYRRIDSDNYLFSYGHSEHSELCEELAGYLSLFIK